MTKQKNSKSSKILIDNGQNFSNALKAGKPISVPVLALEDTIIVEDTGKARLDKFLADNLSGWTRSQIKLQIEGGGVEVNGKTANKAGQEIKHGDKIVLKFSQDGRLSEVLPEDIELEIVYEDEDMAVINKPQGMVVHPAPGSYQHTLVSALLYHFGKLSDGSNSIRPGIVHRIDKDTSGLLVVAKTNEAHNNLAAQIASRTAHRHYLALLEGNLAQDSGTIEANIGRNPRDRKQMAVVDAGKPAKTHYKVVEKYINYTLVEFILDTGRTHQIRVHAKYIGHPVVGDKIYGYAKQKFNLGGQLLHAYKLELDHPKTGKRMVFECALPSYFADTLKKLKKI